MYKLYTSIIAVGIILGILAIEYMVFHIIFFIISSCFLLFVFPYFFAIIFLKIEKTQDSQLHIYEIVSCCLFSLIPTAFNHYISQLPKLIEQVEPYTQNTSISLQNFNIVSYIIPIFIFLGIYTLSKKHILARRTVND